MENLTKISYMSETLDFLLKKSSESRNYNEINYLETIQQGKITSGNREELINWVSEICSMQKTSKTTEQLAIYYIDSFLSKKAINQLPILELIGFICISLALKYEEGREITAKQINALCDGKFNIEAIITTEVYVLNILDWQLDRPTPSELLHYLFAFTCDEAETRNICKYTENFITVALADYHISRNSPIIIAVASALCVLEKEKYQEFGHKWLEVLNKELHIETGILIETAEKIKDKISSLMVL